jgi:hypothetical protein
MPTLMVFTMGKNAKGAIEETPRAYTRKADFMIPG